MIFDTWTIFHFLAGIGIGVLIGHYYKKKNKIYLALVPIIGWELYEQAILVKTQPYVAEVIENSLLDVGVGFAGVYIGYNLITKGKLL